MPTALADAVSRLAQVDFRTLPYIAVSHVTMPAGWRLPSEVHRDQYQMLVLLRGALEAEVEGRSYRAASGDVLLYSAGMVHSERNAGGGCLEAIFIGFGFARQRIRLPVYSRDPAGRIHHLAHWMLDQTPATTEARLFTLRAALMSVLAEHSGAPPDAHSELLARVREFVRVNLSKSITLDDLATAAGLSRFYFVRAFRRAAGQSPMRYVQQMRVQVAHGMLMTNDAPLKQIAKATGFADQFHLSRTCRKLLGRSPAFLRRCGL